MRSRMLVLWVLSVMLLCASALQLRAACSSGSCYLSADFDCEDTPTCRVKYDSGPWHYCCDWGNGNGCCSTYYIIRQCGDYTGPKPPPTCWDGWVETQAIPYQGTYCPNPYQDAYCRFP